MESSNSESAKQATPQAIAALINRYLQPKGITAKSSFKDGCLQIMLESANVPSQKVLVPAIHRLMTKLVTESIQKVKVYGKQTGDDFPAWNEEFALVKQSKDSVPSIDKESGIVKNSSTPVESEPQTQAFTDSVSFQTTLNVDAGLKESAKQGDVTAISSLINSLFHQNDLAIRVTLRNGLLQTVIASPHVPSQESSVAIIRDLVTNLESSMIQKVKVVGMQEVTGSTNSKVVWNENFEIEVKQEQLEDSSHHDTEEIAEVKKQYEKFTIKQITKFFLSNPIYARIGLGFFCFILLIIGYDLLFNNSPEKIVSQYLAASVNGKEQLKYDCLMLENFDYSNATNVNRIKEYKFISKVKKKVGSFLSEKAKSLKILVTVFPEISNDLEKISDIEYEQLRFEITIVGKGQSDVFYLVGKQKDVVFIEETLKKIKDKEKSLPTTDDPNLLPQEMLNRMQVQMFVSSAVPDIRYEFYNNGFSFVGVGKINPNVKTSDSCIIGQLLNPNRSR